MLQERKGSLLSKNLILHNDIEGKENLFVTRMKGKYITWIK
jgi:hypothetical protein